MPSRGQNVKVKALLLFLVYFVTSSPFLHVIVQAVPSSEIIEENPTASEVLKWNTESLIDGNDDDDEALSKLEPDKRYMRFGRAVTDEKWQEEDKRYMRFGRMPPSAWMRENLAADKRYMRFGRAFHDPMNSEENLDAEKRYMRFGKSYNSDEQNGIEEDKRYMRFGRDAGEEKDDKKEDKRYMRFGRAALYDTMDPRVQWAVKRYMRFGRKIPDDFWSKGDDEIMADKRYMRFGRRISRSVPSDQQTFITSTNDLLKISDTLPKIHGNEKDAHGSNSRDKTSQTLHESSQSKVGSDSHINQHSM